jgi:hypothetical protein
MTIKVKIIKQERTFLAADSCLLSYKKEENKDY